jgi:hypothetical protein
MVYDQEVIVVVVEAITLQGRTNVSTSLAQTGNQRY